MNNKSFKLSGICFTGGWLKKQGGLGLFAGLVGPVGFAPMALSTRFLDKSWMAPVSVT